MGKLKPTTAPQRRKHTNSRLGCLNCKKKKIRCDEILPSCKNCLKGKNQTCSYLSLSVQEIEKIKLTHSLRNSQNKLLNQDFRLPSNIASLSNTKGDLNGDILDMKFELKNLPIPLPKLKYSTIEFSNSSINDFKNDYIVKNDKLPNGIDYKVKFAILKSSSFQKVNMERVSSKSIADLSYQVVIGKSNLLDHISDLLLTQPPLKSSQKNVLIESYILLGESIMRNVLQRKQKILETKEIVADKIELYVNALNKRCLERYNYCKHDLAIRSRNIDNESHLPTSQFSRQIEFIAFSSYLLNFAVLMMGFGATNYFNSSKGIFLAYHSYYKYMLEHNTPPVTTVIFLQNNLHFNIMSINIPSYEPDFLFEIESNLRNLQFIYFSSSFFFINNPTLHESSLTLEFYYKSLMSFINENLLPIVYSLRNKNFITTYPPNAIYEIFKRWHSICPSEAMNYVSAINYEYYDQSIYLNALSTTLFMYYYAVAASLDAVFPSCKYLYSMTFMLPTNTFFKNRSIMTVPRDNPYLKTMFEFKIDELLQRHICYASRLFAFFRRRFVFYYNNMTWKNPFDDENLKNNRFKTRVYDLSIEIPIKSFNTTLIRPEHYPSRNYNSLGNPYLNFTREDDTMSKHLYARNIETLDLFNESQLIQYDYETLLLLRDYRPLDDSFAINRSTLNPKDIGDYYKDKVLILNSLSQAL
ncbi:unnamed protein product [Candida verbasci]|uniref:Zn(2)-C6 fungal-type domain-containing protein n=1 Tax=Candida verbasci TaxID=1227364 RepID=A0A9W4X9X6_9ASCO|nr:unnamed protein product [Candida verbasci]